MKEKIYNQVLINYFNNLKYEDFDGEFLRYTNKYNLKEDSSILESLITELDSRNFNTVKEEFSSYYVEFPKNENRISNGNRFFKEINFNNFKEIILKIAHSLAYSDVDDIYTLDIEHTDSGFKLDLYSKIYYKSINSTCISEERYVFALIINGFAGLKGELLYRFNTIFNQIVYFISKGYSFDVVYFDTYTLCPREVYAIKDTVCIKLSVGYTVDIVSILDYIIFNSRFMPDFKLNKIDIGFNIENDSDVNNRYHILYTNKLEQDDLEYA